MGYFVSLTRFLSAAESLRGPFADTFGGIHLNGLRHCEVSMVGTITVPQWFYSGTLTKVAAT